MKIERLVSAGVAMAVALGLAASAQAGIVTVTYQGVVYGADLLAEFGVPGGDLNGYHYTAVYTINDALGVSFYDPLDYSGISGEAVSATITINGVTIAEAGNSKSSAFQYALAAGEAGTSEWVYNDHSELLNWLLSSAHSIGPSYDYHVPFAYNFQSGDESEGYFQDYSSDLDLYPTSVTVADVPEPATWAMLILGVAMIGFAARRRNECATLAA